MSLVTKHIYYAKTGDDLVREQKWNESERSQQLGRGGMVWRAVYS